MLLDRQPNQVRWYIGDEEGNPVDGIVQPLSSQVGQIVRTVYDPIGSKLPGRKCYTFTIEDDVGDGLCCSRGSGTYQVYLGWNSLFSSNGTFAYGQRLRFGRDCDSPLEVVEGFAATIDLIYDNFPNQTTWRVERADGTALHGVDNVTLGPNGQRNVQDIVHWFPETASDGCVYFLIFDSNGDGICCDGDPNRAVSGANGRYRLAVNGAVVHTSIGRYGFGERVQFGRDCPVDVTPATVVSVALTVGVGASETRWYIGDKNGNPLGAIEQGLANQPSALARQVVFDPIGGPPSECYTFTVVDDAGDGMQGGSYNILLGQQLLSTRGGSFGFGERVRFGSNCAQPQPQVFRGYMVGYEVNLENPSTGATWRIHDVQDNTLVSSDFGDVFSGPAEAVVGPLSNTTGATFHFPDPVVTGDDCLFFSVGPRSDVPGPSIYSASPPASSLHYNLLVNKASLLENSGELRWGQRVRFGSGNCVTDVQVAVLLTIEIGLDDKPIETGWTLTDLATNATVAEVLPGFYSAAGVVSETVAVFDRGSYRFDVIDTGGDGICCSNGQGYYRLYLDRSAANASETTVTLLVEGAGDYQTNAVETFVASSP